MINIIKYNLKTLKDIKTFKIKHFNIKKKLNLSRLWKLKIYIGSHNGPSYAIKESCRIFRKKFI